MKSRDVAYVGLMRDGTNFAEVDSNPDWRRGKHTDSTIRDFLFPPANKEPNVFTESISVAWRYLSSNPCTAEKRRLRFGVQSDHAEWYGTFVWHAHWCLGETSCHLQAVSDSSC